MVHPSMFVLTSGPPGSWHEGVSTELIKMSLRLLWMKVDPESKIRAVKSMYCSCRRLVFSSHLSRGMVCNHL